MISGRYQVYPEYKESGVEWLGPIPRDWKLCPLKFLAKIKNGQDYKHVEADTGYPVMGSGGRFTYASKFMYEKESVLLGRKGTIDKPLYINEPFWTVDTMYYTEIAHSACAKFVYYLALIIQFKKFSTNTALPSMTQEHLGNYVFAVPSKRPEQTQIAAFLDHETAKIDRLIEKQQGLIALLKEKRQAVISHAVTQGLNPHAPRKDSGIEWLGQVPEHWVPTQLKFLIREIDQGKSPECEARLASLDEWGVLKSGCVNRGVFCEEEHKALPSNIRPTASAEVKEGDLLMSRASGSTDLIGSVGLVGNVRPRLMMSDKIFRLQPEPSVLPKFIWRLAASTPVRKQIELSINGAEGLANNITKESIGRLLVTCPPLTEQEGIVSHLEIRCAQIDRLVSNAESAVTLLQERRTALISAAVTGKIDVRAWQPSVVSKLETTATDKTRATTRSQ